MSAATPIERVDACVSALLEGLASADALHIAQCAAALSSAMRDLVARDEGPTTPVERRRLELVQAQIVEASRRINRLTDTAARKQAVIGDNGGAAAPLTYRGSAKRWVASSQG